MKKVNRLLALLLALVMVLSLSVSAFAAVTEVTAGTGSILIRDTETVKASQKTFAAYRILDLRAYVDDTIVDPNADNKTYAYTVPEVLEDFYVDYFKTKAPVAKRVDLDKTAHDFDLKVVDAISKLGEDNAKDLFDFATAAMEAAKAAKIVPVTNGTAVTTGAEPGYQFSNLPLGYYVIADTTGGGDYEKPVSALILDTVTPNVKTEVKAEKPPVDKDIDQDNNLGTTNDRVDANNAAIGDTVTYVITSKVPEMLGYEKYFFVMNDKLSKGLTYNDDMVIKVGNTTLTADAYTLTKTDNEDGTTSLKIVFKNFLQYNTAAYVDQPITVTYSATVNENAAIGLDPNTNEVTLTYSNNPNVDSIGKPGIPDEPDDTDPVGKTPESKVETYTTALEIKKTDPAGNPLTGAEFVLKGTAVNKVRVNAEFYVEDANGTYWKLKDGTYTTTDPHSTDASGASVDHTKYEDINKKYSKTSIINGIKEEGKTDVTVTATVDADGILRFEGLAAGDYTITETKAPAGYNALKDSISVEIDWTWNDTTKKADFSFKGATEVNDTGIAQVTVVNQAGAQLPSTGGMGTTLLYVIGGLMVMGAVVVLITKKRMAE